MKVLVTGPESSGKSTLARSLAWALDGRYVAEQSRSYLPALGRPYSADDLLRLLDLQLAAERAAAGEAPSYLLCDTGPFNLWVWSEEKYSNVPPAIRTACALADYDLILLCRPDLPYAPDPLREHPDRVDRERFFARFGSLLPSGRVRTIGGADRTEQALGHLLAFNSSPNDNGRQ